MTDILQKIVEHKKEEVRLLKKRRGAFQGRSDAKRPFRDALDIRPNLAVIAEVKKASPSKGIIDPEFNPEARARQYHEGGASAVSVLTDVDFFQGSPDYLTAVRNTISEPVLRKDFIIDPLQVLETATLNADGMLLIAACLSDGQMDELYHAALELDIDPLIEIHDSGELDRVMKLEPNLIGINNRNLKTFDTDIARTLELLPVIPRNVTVVSESGIFTESDTKPLRKAGVHAVLVGESLMRSRDCAALIRQLRCTPE